LQFIAACRERVLPGLVRARFREHTVPPFVLVSKHEHERVRRQRVFALRYLRANGLDPLAARTRSFRYHRRNRRGCARSRVRTDPPRRVEAVPPHRAPFYVIQGTVWAEQGTSVVDALGDITGLLRRAEAGEPAACEALLPLVYQELKRLSHSVRDGHDAPTLNTTALVHEAWLRLVGTASLSWPDRHRFFAYAAQAMRSILVDRARQHLAQKRWGSQQRVEWDAALDLPGDDAQLELLELDAGLARLEQVDADLARIVELHVFAGLAFADVAQCLGVAERSVFRSWHKAKAILHGLLAAG
jgi:RNA polymerase sigma factor (TIGR02999 family)